MITEKAYRPYYYKTQKEGRLTYLTKAHGKSPMILWRALCQLYDKRHLKKEMDGIEGFVFAPASNKRDQMFELNTILDAVVLSRLLFVYFGFSFIFVLFGSVFKFFNTASQSSHQFRDFSSTQTTKAQQQL